MIKINATFILTILNFLLLVSILAKILWAPMLKFLDERTKKISDSLKLAEKNIAREKELEIEHDELVKEARSKAADIVDKAMASASNESRSILAEAREHAQTTVESAREEIKMEAERIKQDLRKEVAAMTVSLAGKVLEREIKEDDHRELIKKNLDILES